MTRRGLNLFIISCCILTVVALAVAQEGTSRSTEPTQSSARSSVPTGGPLVDRRAVDEEKANAPAPRPRVRDGGDSPPVIAVPPVAPAGD